MKNLLLFLVAAFLFTGCLTTRKNYIILIDISDSILPKIQQNYLDIVKDILPGLHANDKLTILLIDDGGISKAERIFTIDLSKYNFTNPLDGMNSAPDSNAARRERFVSGKVASEMIEAIKNKTAERKGLGEFTDIIAAVKSASALLIKKNEATTLQIITNGFSGKENFEYENVIIVLSDMINEDRSGAYNLTTIHLWDEATINKKAEDLSKMNRLPDLHGAKILVYGATSAGVTGNAAEVQVEKTRLFWTSYFYLANAQILAYGYDTQSEIRQYVSEEE